MIANKKIKIPKSLLMSYASKYIEEDAFYGDITFLPDREVKAVIVAKESFVLSGVELAEACFEVCGAKVVVEKRDGEIVKNGEVIIVVEGNSSDVFLAERTALNAIQRMSGIATATRKLVDMVKDYGVKIAATRKTTPGFRVFEKLAVVHGGGDPHRMSLSDCVILKDNHLKLFELEEAIKSVKISFTKKIEVEVNSVKDAVKAALAGADIVMLDNMSVEEVKFAVSEVRKVSDAILEASGRITPDNVVDYAKTGVDVISSGWITHSSRAVDVSMRVVEVEGKKGKSV